MTVKCDRCEKRLSEPGGLAFSPPKRPGFVVNKYHLCVACWNLFTQWMVQP